MGRFSNPLVMSFTGIEGDDSGMGAKAFLGSSAPAITENPHRLENGI